MRLKVYGCNEDGRYRAIVAATSQKAAAELIGISVNHLREYGSQTGNAKEIEIAMRRPGMVWRRHMSRPHYPWELGAPLYMR